MAEDPGTRESSAEESAGPTPVRVRRSRGGRIGRIVANVLFFSVLAAVVVAGAGEILGETLFAARIPREAAACRDELALLRARLDEATRAERSRGERAAIDAFHTALDGGDATMRGIDWDRRALALVDGCPAREANAADALARLRAADEAMVRVEAQQLGPARRAVEDTYESGSASTAPSLR